MWSPMALGLQPSALKIKIKPTKSEKLVLHLILSPPMVAMSLLLTASRGEFTVIKSKGAHTCPSIHCIIVCMSCFMLTVVVSLHQQMPPTLRDWEKWERGWTRKWRIGKQWKKDIRERASKFLDASLPAPTATTGVRH